MTSRRVIVGLWIGLLMLGLRAPVVRGVAPCEAADAAPWVTATLERVVSFNGLANYAIGRYGEIASCHSVARPFATGRRA